MPPESNSPLFDKLQAEGQTPAVTQTESTPTPEPEPTPATVEPTPDEDDEPDEDHDGGPDTAKSYKVDVKRALERETQDGKGDEDPGPSDWNGFATDGVETAEND